MSWLREYVDFDLSAERLVDLISLHSQEVESVERMGVFDGEVVVGEVREFGPHPDADKLSVAKVDLGGEVVQIVAGAPNPYPGAKVPVVLPGSTMSDGTKLRKAKLRGLESNGMMMSERELGISPDHEGILLLDDSFEVGRPVADYFPVEETVLDIDVMPNRPDLWGMIGVARELAAILKTDFRIPEPQVNTGGEPTRAYGLRVEAPDLCPRYDLRRVSGVESGRTTPIWMRRWIHAAGMRPISPIVDISNFTMLETGQPNHVFDASEVRGGIVVRRAREGEKMTLLDGSTRPLDENMLLIADEERGLVIAGVMGAEDAEVSETTTEVLIEVATFSGRSVLETSARLGLRTDASGRNERGLDPNMVDFAMERVIGLLTRDTRGRAASDTLSHYPERAEPLTVPLRLERAELLLGMEASESEAARSLEALGCEVRRDDGRLTVSVPTFRRDLTREADLIEEVGRLAGLDRVPEQLPETSLPGGLTSRQRKVRLIRNLLSDLGLAETITYPFGPDRWSEDLGLPDERGKVLRLANPLSQGMVNLRPTLLPGLLDAAARNRAFGSRGGALYEVGRVFESSPPREVLREEAVRFRLTGELDREADALMGVKETGRVGGMLFGTVRSKGWNVPAQNAGFFEARGLVERLAPEASFSPVALPFLHPGRSAVVVVDEVEAGWVGELHPDVAEKFELERWPVAAFELDLSLCDPDPEPRFEPFANVPAVNRDLAVVVERSVSAAELLSAVDSAESTLLRERRIFDVYEGRQVPEGKKSVALSFTFQSSETLTEEEINAELVKISARLEDEFGASVRSD